MARAVRSIVCRSNDGYALEFNEREFLPFLLSSCDGCYTVTNKVTMSDNTMTDGATYQGSVLSRRNIILELRDHGNHAYNRNLLTRLFKSGEAGTLIYTDDLNSRSISYYVESIESDGIDGSRTYTVSLLCDDPYFYDLDDITVRMASWINAFQFIHEFDAAGEEFGYRSLERSQSIYNENAADNIGMTIVVDCIGAVTNPVITHVEKDESISVGSVAKPLDLVYGDRLTITTGTNNKHVHLTRNNVTTEINEYLTEDSVFIQLQRGANTIGYSADAGESNMVVSVTYRMRYASA